MYLHSAKTMDAPKTFGRSDNVEKTNKPNEIDKMRDALTSIACEMQRLESSLESQSSALVSSNSNDQEKLFTDLMKCKTKLKCKRNRIQELKRNLLTACYIAKVMASTRNDNSGLLKKKFSSAQSDCIEFLDNYKNNLQIINSLSRENESLRNKLDSVANIIRLGHQELLKIRGESSEEISILVKLKQLIEFSGEYYAYYCNEHNKCLRLEQKNTFLGNKNRILEKHLEALLEQLSALRLKNDRFKNRFLKSKLCKDLTIAFSEDNMKSRNKENSIEAADDDNNKKYSSDCNYRLDFMQGVDLSPHLSLVNKLLSDQEGLLRDLKNLSEEFHL